MSEQQTFHAGYALLDGGWACDCRISVDSAGMIVSIEQAPVAAGDTVLPGPVLPGMVNVHSHIHQRLIAGLTAFRAVGRDSFWTWREQMYRAVGQLSPAELEMLASLAFMELLEGGYTSTGEFHYPHRLGGAEPFVTASSLLAAAERAGMILTLLPVWYRYGGFGRQPVSERQQPFVMSLDELAGLVADLRRSLSGGHHRIGVAPHSLRAVEAADLPDLLSRVASGPVHLHIAEQPAEVAACREHCGLTPIDLLTRHVVLDERWCLIHATHATAVEVVQVAASPAVVALCPTTEADLGDGLFPVHEFLERGGRVAIGSDANLVMEASRELQLLDWGQRLQRHQRNVLCAEGEHLGRPLWRHAASAGADALEQPAGTLAVGRRADFVVLDAEHPMLAGLTPDFQLDSLVSMTGRDLIDQVWVAGQCRVRNGRHVARDPALEAEIAGLRRRLIEAEST